MIITKEHITKLHSALDAGLTHGLGTQEPGKMCVEAAVCYALGLPHSDDPGCVSPALRYLKITLNDSKWSSNTARAEGMRRLAVAQLGSKDVLDEQQFAKRVARLTIQTVVPAALLAAASLMGGEHNKNLLAATDACEKEPTENNARAAAYAAAGAARAARAAGAAAGAARAARAARAAYAAAGAAYAAADAATDVAAYAAAGAAAGAAAYAAAGAARAARAAGAAAGAARAARAARAAYAAAGAAYAAAGAATDAILSTFAEGIVQILIDMKAPGCMWL